MGENEKSDSKAWYEYKLFLQLLRRPLYDDCVSVWIQVGCERTMHNNEVSAAGS